MEQPRIIDLPKIGDKRGNLSLVEEFKQIPFKIERTYWIYDVPGGEKRGGHAYYENTEFIVALCKKQKVFSLNRSYYGLLVPKGWWRQMENFSTNALALVLASTPYTKEDYIYDYEEFKRNAEK